MTDAIGTCIACKKPVVAFKDRASYREFYQSQLCQDCQDEVFGGAYTCEYCGKQVENKQEGYQYEHHFYCTPQCFQHDVGF